MTERIVAPRLADIMEAIERIRRVLDGVTLEAFEQNWEKRWLVERGIEKQGSAMFFVMLTITSRQMCFGSWQKTIWRKSKKFAVRSWS